MTKFKVLWRTWTRRWIFLSLSGLEPCPCEFSSWTVQPHWTNWTCWNNREVVYRNVNSLFKWRFPWRRRRGCLRSSPPPPCTSNWLTCTLLQQQIDDVEPAVHRRCVKRGLSIKVRYIHVTAGPSYQSFKDPCVPGAGSACHQMSQLTLTEGTSACLQVFSNSMLAIHDGVYTSISKWIIREI